jgi:hypothetical protein
LKFIFEELKTCGRREFFSFFNLGKNIILKIKGKLKVKRFIERRLD